MSIQLSFDTMGVGISSNDWGELVSPNGAIITPEYLKLGLRYNTEKELAEDVLGIDIYQLNNLFEEFGLKAKACGVQLTKSRIKIMCCIKRYYKKYNEYPTLEYVGKRLKMDIETTTKELKYLAQHEFIQFTKGKIQKIVREV